MSQLPSPSSHILPESVPSTMCPMSSQVEWDEEVESWSVDIVEEEEVSNDSVMKDCVDGKEVNGDFEARVEEPKIGMEFNTHDEAYLYYTRFAKEKGFAVAKRSSKKGKDGMLKHVILQCSRGGKPRPRGSNPAKARPQCKVECPAHLNVIHTKEGKWMSNRALDENVRRKLVLNEQDGIRLNKTVASLHIEAGGPDKVPNFAEGLPGRLRNVFWADARSRAACKEFGDVVTFDTNIPGEQTWLECMWGCAPKAIITDQCQAMRNAIQNIFPDTRHRWCIWHIMKKVPEKLSGYEAYQRIRYHFHQAVYDSLTMEEFEKVWDGFMKKYDLQSNTWLHGLYLEKERWVPAYVKDMFWAGMSSTQRSENMQSWYSFIPCITNDDLEKQFQNAYTNDKFGHFRDEFLGKMACSLGGFQVGHVWTEYEVKESITIGEGEEDLYLPIKAQTYLNRKELLEKVDLRIKGSNVSWKKLLRRKEH
ncbi:hypothetical protein Acr_10g0009000 [Actinidia rufa]|uniref:Protein FAR1-RELATED SEQUENCE n=1 Tax=Actinidia rufa TaxID=165716 RepID=A0A7J0FA27_9ERIC|nr:hypothetical protein Acr_10g0009000 [Actinidia rufa]